MKNILTLLILFLSTYQVKSQVRDSFLYNEKGQLFLDTTLTISKEQYISWTHSEFNLIACFSNVEYPRIYLENGIKQKDHLLISFICDSIDIKEIKVLNDSSVFAAATIDELKKQGKKIASLLKKGSSYSSKGVYLGRYYLAISFELIYFYEQLRKLKAVPIIKSSVPLISISAH